MTEKERFEAEVKAATSGSCPVNDTFEGFPLGPHEPLTTPYGTVETSPIVGMNVYVCKHCRVLYCPETFTEQLNREAEERENKRRQEPPPGAT